MANQTIDVHSVYLAGPMTGCNTEQQRLWRNEFSDAIQRRHKGVKPDDPVTWGTDFDPLRESLAIRASDLVVANMWKESVGTCVGIVQAVSVGKPVVVIDPNYLNSRIIEGLVTPENVVHSVPEAVTRADAILSSLQRLRVRKVGAQGVLQESGRNHPGASSRARRSARPA